MKIYNLTIVYDDKSDTIEYIEETIEDESEYEVSQLAKQEGWDEETARSVIQGIIEKAEA